jgi:hypothetical protein
VHRRQEGDRIHVIAAVVVAKVQSEADDAFMAFSLQQEGRPDGGPDA